MSHDDRHDDRHDDHHDDQHDLPADVVAAVADHLGATVTPAGRLIGGLNGGSVRVQVEGRPDAVLKAVPLLRPGQLAETARARRVVDRMRARGYPTPAWFGAGATATHVWHLTEFVDAAPAAELTAFLVEELMDVVELQAGQGAEPYDHWSYAWHIATGAEPVGSVETTEQFRLRTSVARLPEFSAEAAALVERARTLCADVPHPLAGLRDMVHADLTPGNVLVRDGRLVAVVDIGNAGSGTRASDLVDLVWNCDREPLQDVRRRVWARMLAVAGWDGVAVVAATRVLLALEFLVRLGRLDLVPDVLERGHRMLDEVAALR